MKKTLFLTNILAAVVACSGILHAQEENGPREMKGNQTYNMIADEKFALSVTGQNNWIKMDNQHRTHVTFTYQNPTSIVNGELSLEKVKIGPDMGDEKWEMGANSRLNLGGTDAALIWFKITGPSAEINNGVLNLWEGQSYTLGGNLGGTAGIVMKDNSRLDLGGKTLANPMTIDSSAAIGNGSYNGALNVDAGKTLTLCGNLGGTGNITLGDNAKLNLNGNSISKAIDWNVNSVIEGGGNIRGNLILRDNTSYTWNYTAVQIVGNVVLGAGSMFELKGQSIGSATLTASNSVISNANIVGTFALGDGVSYTWSSDALYICGDVSLGDKAALNLGGHGLDNAVSMKGTATIGRGTLNGTLSMGGGKTLNLGGNLSGSGTIAMAANDVLNLGGFELGTAVAVNGSATIGNGWFHGALSVAANQTLSLNADVKGTGSVILGNDASLNLGGATLANDVILQGNATLDSGTLGGAVTGGGIVKTGADKLDLKGAVELNRLEVQEGALNIMNNADLNKVQDVTIAANATLGVYQGETETEANEGTLTIQEDKALTAGEGATLNANLVMKAGSKLDVSTAQGGNGLIMGSEVTIESDALLSNASLGAQVDDFNAFLFDYLTGEGAPEYYYLFDSVEELYIQQGDEVKPFKELDFVNARNMDMDASRVFANLDENTYALVYNWDPIHENVVALRMMPEPTTGVLSLLALGLLAGRRRRH